MLRDAPRPGSSSAASPAPRPEALRRRARALLDERFGSSETAPSEGYACGNVGLLAEHTHYSDGFAVVRPLAQGTAVAVQSASSGPSRVVMGEGGASFARDPDGARPPSLEARAALAVVNELAPGPVEAAAASDVPAACFDARVTALGTALARALGTLGEDAAPEQGTARDERVRACLSEGTGVPFAPFATRPPVEDLSAGWLLGDTATREQLPVEAPPSGELGWGLVALAGRAEEDGEPARPPAFHRERRQQAGRALRLLREKGFTDLRAFRDLEHRDLERAQRVVPSPLQPVVRHLVTENRRVPRLVRAARSGDWQLLGALLLMSHASLRDDWQSTPAPLDAVVEAAEEADDLYGARLAGRGPCVLVVGRPQALPDFFRQAAGVLERQFGRAAETVLL